MNGKSLAEWGYLKPAEFDGPNRLNDVARLLGNAVIEYVRFNIHFGETIDYLDFPMGYGELQNHGVMFHSFHHALTSNPKDKGAVFAEYPFRLDKYRYKEQPENHRIDFWVLLRNEKGKDTVLLVEYKHKWASVRKPYVYQDWDHKTGKSLLSLGNLAAAWKEDWVKLREKATRYSHLRDSFLSCEPDKCNLVRIVLMTIPVCQDSLTEGELKAARREDFATHLEEVSKGLEPKPNWTAYWWLPENQQEAVSTWNDRDRNTHYSYYRGMYFLATLERVPK
jgi:hypothetical protein